MQEWIFLKRMRILKNKLIIGENMEIKDIDFKEILYDIRTRYIQNRYVEKSLPEVPWLRKDPLGAILKQYKKLFKKGLIYYGVLVQANELLFRRDNNINCPANMLYCTDECVNENPLILQNIAEDLFYYKDKSNDEIPEQYKEIVKVIRAEIDRSFFAFDYMLADGRTVEIHFISIMIYRKYLPGNFLEGSIFPIITCPNMYKYDTAMLVPKMYWSEELICYNYK